MKKERGAPKSKKVSDRMELFYLDEMTDEARNEFLDNALGEQSQEIRKALNILYNSCKAIENTYDNASKSLNVKMGNVAEGAFAAIALSLQIFNFVSTMSINVAANTNKPEAYIPAYGESLIDAAKQLIDAITDVEAQAQIILKERGVSNESN